jgi:hypothetical protein
MADIDFGHEVQLEGEKRLVPYSRKSVIKNKKSEGYYKIRMLK